MNLIAFIFTLLRVIVFGVLIGVFLFSVPAVAFFGYPQSMAVGVNGALAGCALVALYNLYQYITKK